MTRAWTLRASMRGAVYVCAAAACMIACDPSDPCDSGYYEEHGSCRLLPSDAGGDSGGESGGESGGGASPSDDDDAGPNADSDADSDAASNADPYAGFGDDCTEQTDCPDALVCGAPMLPYCTAINCMDDAQLCPPDWLCFDTMGMSPDPTVTSVCLNL